MQYPKKHLNHAGGRKGTVRLPLHCTWYYGLDLVRAQDIGFNLAVSETGYMDRWFKQLVRVEFTPDKLSSSSRGELINFSVSVILGRRVPSKVPHSRLKERLVIPGHTRNVNLCRGGSQLTGRDSVTSSGVSSSGV